MCRGNFQRNRPPAKLKIEPHTPSRFTGMMGTSTPLIMRSIPRRKGSIWPIRVICPSGKIPTISPFFSASVARRKEWIISRGRCSERRQRRPEENSARAEMSKMRGRVIRSGSGGYAHKRKPVRRSDDDTFLIFLWLVLDQSADRHNKKSAKEAQCRE